MPPGYLMALRWSLAELLLPGYGVAEPTQIGLIREYAANGRSFIKRTNMQPQQQARFDVTLIAGKRKDSGWILNGGFI